MPLGTSAKQEIQALIRALDGITYASNKARDSGESFIKTMQTLSQGRQTLTTFDELITKFRIVANFAMLSRKEIDKYEATLRRLAASGKIPFGSGGVGSTAKGQVNITSAGGKQVPDYQSVFMQRGATETIPGGSVAIKNVTKALGEYRGSLKDLTSVHTDAITGVTRWSAQLKSVPGVVREVNMVTGSMGQVIQSSARGFRSWGSAVGRDISEFLKWSIAASVIYVPLRKLNELFKESIDIQTKLADIQIAVGGSTSITAKAYEEAAKVADMLGVHLAGVMDGYVLAYRAAGSIVEPTQRATLATKLLADSMILSKLSGMEQSAALDTLVGALRQLNMPLDQGVQLLDKWVAITKVANVDLKTLSESFAITATASENAGLSVDKLNAIIAVVAETTILSSTEAGNAVRAFMSGFTREESAAALEKFGISVKNAAGELKSFDQISREVYERRQLGLIDDQAFAKLSETLGGRGARRGAQVQAYLSNLPRVEQLATVSLNAHGDAADALNIQLETLQTAINRLGVAFSNMARTLGAEGGFLDLFKNITNLATGLIDAFSGITKALGTATPALLAFAGAMLLLKKNAAIQYLGTLSPLQILGGKEVTAQGPGGRYLTRMVPPTGGLQAAAYGAAAGSPLAKQPIGQTASAFFGTGGGQIATGAMTGVMMAALSGSLAGSEQDFGKAGAQIGSAIIGTLIAGGNPIGGIIGSTIVTSLIDNLVNREVDVVSAFERIFTKAQPGAGPTEEERAKTERERLTSALFTALGGIESRGRGLVGVAAASGERKVRPSEEAIENYALALAGIVSGEVTASYGAKFWANFLLGDLPPEAIAEVKAIYEEMIRLGKDAAEKAAGPALPTTIFGQMIQGTTQQYGGVAGGVFGAQKQTVTTQLGKGQTGVRDLQALMDQEAGFATKVSTIYAALTANNKRAGVSFKEVAELVINLSTDESTAIMDTANALGDVINKLEEMGKAGADDYAARQQRLPLIAEEARLQGLLSTQVEQAVAGQKYKTFEQPDYVTVAAGTTPAQIRKAVDEAKRLSQIKLESITMDPAEQMKIVDDWGKIAIATVDAVTGEWRKMPGILEGIDKEILSKKLEMAGLLADSMKVGLETPDLPSSQAGQLRGNMEYYRKLLMSNPAGAALLGQEKPEKLAVLFSDNIVKEMVVSRTLFSLALRDIIKNQEEQVEGIFNIPEGMTAMIPHTGKLFFSDQPIDKGMGAGGLLEALGPPIDEFGTSTGTFSGAVDKFAGLMSANPAFNKAMEAKMDRMEQEFEKQWRAANPAPTPARTDEDVCAAKKAEYAKKFAIPTEEEVYAAKEAEYAKRYATPEETSKKFDTTGLQTMGPGEDIINWIKGIFAELGTLAQTFSENWGNGGGGAVQRGLAEADTQGLLPTEGPKLDTSNIGEDLKFIFDSIIQTFGTYLDAFKNEAATSSFKPEEMKTMGPSGEGVLEWVKGIFEQLGILAQTFSENWGPGGGATGGDVQRGLSEAERQNLLPTEGPKLDTSNIGEDLKYIFDALGQTFQQIFGMFAQELGIGGAVGGGKGLAKMTEQSGGGITGGASGGIYMQPLSLPVTINTRIVNQTSILLDGYKIQQAINERQNSTLKTASRRAGAGGFIVEA